MANGNEEQVTESTDGFDIAEIAAGLGIKTQAPETTTETKTPAPDESTETQDDEAETATTEDKPEDTAGEESDDAADDAKTDEESDEETVPEGKDDTEPTKVQRRIDRLTAEKHELREERDAIKTELEALRKQAEAKPPMVTVDPENPLSSFTDAAALEAEIQRAQAVLEWAEDNRDGGSVTAEGGEKFYDADAVKMIKANCRSILRAAPKQQEYLRQREQVLPEAQAVYPDFFKPGTSAKAFLDATLKTYPFITRIPSWELVIGDAFVGQSMRLAKLEQMQRKQSSGKAHKSPAATAKVPKTPAPTARPKVSNSSEASLRQKAERVFKSGGDSEAITDYLEALV